MEVAPEALFASHHLILHVHSPDTSSHVDQYHDINVCVSSGETVPHLDVQNESETSIEKDKKRSETERR